jgi:hypothetical protein
MTAVALHGVYLMFLVAGASSQLPRKFDPLWLPAVLIPEIAFALIVNRGHRAKRQVHGLWALGIVALLGLAVCFPLVVDITGGRAFSGIPRW